MNSWNLMEKSTPYKELLYRYCVLCAKPTLTDTEAEQIDQILAKAEIDPYLSFLIDEADHMLAHEMELVNPAFIQQQQLQLGNTLRWNQGDTISSNERTISGHPGPYKDALGKLINAKIFGNGRDTQHGRMGYS